MKSIDISELKVRTHQDSLYKVELIVKNICDNSTFKLNDFTLSRLSKNYIAKNGICYVPAKGLYKVERFGMNSFDTYQIDIKSENTIDTLIRYKIYIASRPGIPGWPYYAFCGKPCDGKLTDYYENGNIRITGIFKNGHFKNLKQYNKEGKLVLVIKESRLNSLTEVYENDKLILRMKRVLFFGFGKVWNPEKNRYQKEEYYEFK